MKFQSEPCLATNVKTKRGYFFAVSHSLAWSLAVRLPVLNSCIWHRREMTEGLLLLRNNMAQDSIFLPCYLLNGPHIRLLFRNCQRLDAENICISSQPPLAWEWEWTSLGQNVLRGGKLGLEEIPIKKPWSQNLLYLPHIPISIANLFVFKMIGVFTSAKARATQILTAISHKSV